jgi:hypothetical protein
MPPKGLRKATKRWHQFWCQKSIFFQAFVLYLAALPWPGMPIEDFDNNNAYLGNVQKFPFSETQLPFGQTELP